MGDPNWFYSTLAQSSAAIVGLAGGFMVSRVLAQRSDLADDRSVLRGQMQSLQADANRRIQDAQRISDTLRKALPAARGTQRLDVSQLETFSHPGNHGQVEVRGADPQSLELVEGIAADAIAYKDALTKLAKDEKTLSDNLRTGKNAADLAPAWLNEEAAGMTGGTLYETLGRQRDWMRNEWQRERINYDSVKEGLATLRARAGIRSLAGLVVVLALFLFIGVLVPLAYLSARTGSSRVVLLAAFGTLALLFLIYLANEVRRLSNALRLEHKVW